jgi:sigma-B regulation protein RsbU (phosphoserine phosphatase)
MNEPSVSGENATALHAVRTKLNHIVGYGDILRLDAEESGRKELAEDFSRIRDAALALREPLARRLSGSGAAALEAAESERLDQLAYGILYELVARLQSVKGKAQGFGERDFAEDIEKMLEASNGILELLSIESAGASEDPPGDIFAPEPELAEDRLEPPKHIGRILVVDDNLFNRELLARHLERQGHHVRAAADGVAALESLVAEEFDIAIIDLMMPGMNGYQLLERIKADEKLSDLYVIVISALDDTQSIARCIRLGAEDYLPREFEPVILRARIESCLEKKRLKAEQELYVAALVDTQERLRAELRGGAAYVRSLLPPRIDEADIRSDWMFLPSASLGGDVFGYGRLDRRPSDTDAGRFALYLIDVSGHGIESALFSCTLLNLLKTQVLPGADFLDPGSVFAKLNASFRMEEQNNLYFTAWYGVWDPRTRELAYASAGSPPAVLILPGGGAVELVTGGMLVGLDTEAHYEVHVRTIPKGSKLYLFSDGIYEFRTKAGAIFGLDAFIAMLEANAAASPPGSSALDAVLKEAKAKAARSRFLDDVSLVEFVFA